MSAQITFLPTEETTKLEVIEMQFLGSTYTCAEELFHGFNHLRAITFSYGLDFISKIMDNFDTVEIILGCEAMVKFDLKAIMAFQTRALEEIEKYKQFSDRINNKTLTFWIAKEILSHQKIYILSDDFGRSRVIFGSANFSARPFSGEQRENIGYFENDAAAYEFFSNEFDTLKQLSTNEIAKETLFINLKSDEDIVSRLPIVREAKVNKAGIILENTEEDPDSVEFVYDIKGLINKYSKLVPKEEKKRGAVIVKPATVIEMIKRTKQHEKEMKEKRAKRPQFIINYEDGSLSFNEKPYKLDSDIETVRQDLINISEYFAGFDSFIGEIDSMKHAYFCLMNYLFLSPFVANLRYEANKNDFPTTLFPIYAIINGPKSAGKTFFIDTIQTIMYGRTLGRLAPDTFTKTGIFGIMRESTGVPLHIDDIDRERFNRYCGQIVKYDSDLLDEKLINHPVIIMTTNEIQTIKPEFAKRVYYVSVDAQLTNVVAASLHKKMVDLRKRITTSFYKEYLKRMYDKVLHLIEEMNIFEFNDENEDWKPDVFQISTQTIIEIYNDCGLEIPKYVTELKYADYFGHNILTEGIRQKIVFDWTHNKKAFKVMRKRNVLEYIPGERPYEAVRVCDALPEILRAKNSGIKVVMQLDEAEKFFGVHFKGRLF